MVAERRRAGGKKAYYARFRTAEGWTEEICPGGTKRDAQRLESQRKREVADGTYRKGGTSTDVLMLETYAKEWLASRRNKTKSDDEQRIRDYVLPVLGKRRLRDLEAMDCITFVRGLVARGINPKTVSNIWGALRTMMRDANLAKLVSFFPVMPRGIIPARQSDIHEIYSNEDVQELIIQGRSEMDLFALIAFYTGMREGEICGLRWSDYERDEDPRRLGSLLVRRQYSGAGDDASTKTGRVRRVPVHPVLARALECAWLANDTGKAHPIVSLRLGEHHTKSTAYKAFRRHCQACSVTSIGIHRTRHTAITAMRRGGAPKDLVEQITHNSKGTIVDRYTHDWTLLCAAVSVIDYGCRGMSRGGRAELPSGTEIAPGSIPGASTRQPRTPRDNCRQSATGDVAKVSGFPFLSTRRGTHRENLHRASAPRTHREAKRLPSGLWDYGDGTFGWARIGGAS